MALKMILGADNPILRTRSKEISSFDKKLLKLAKQMIETMHAQEGVGLAAPQIGENIRMFVMKFFQQDGEKYSIWTVINPIIIETSSDMEIDTEGCLSLPDIQGKVARYRKIILSFLNERGEKQKIKLEGLNARIAQHEIDHLDGVLFIDRMEKK